MRLFRKSIALLVLLLAMMAMVPFVTAATDSYAVSVEEARSVAETSAQRIAATSSEFSDWKGTDVRHATIYYDLTGNRSAYSFEVTAGGKSAGYLIISATRENFPVLEYSRGETPDRNGAMKARADQLAAEEAGAKRVSIGTGRPLYLGATFFYMEYPVDMSGQRDASKTRILVDLYEDRIVTPEPINIALDQFKTNVTELQRFQQWKKQEIEDAWTAIDKNGLQIVDKTDVVKNSVATTFDEIKTISDVPYYLAIHPAYGGYGCTPAAASMVLGYWRNRGLTRLPTPTNQTTGDNLTRELAIAMGTNMGDGSTNPLNMPVGMNEVMEENYDYSYSSMNGAFSPGFSIQNEINSDRPFMLSMLLGGAPQEGGLEYGMHSVAAVGYVHVSGSPEYITLHDGWVTTDRHIASGNWAAAMNTFERPDSTYTITASAGNHGSIYSSGSVQVPIETRKTFTITPDPGCAITGVTVDGQSVGAVSSYTFEGVTADHTISATFGQNALAWNWAQSGWGDWQCWAETPSGLSTPYGPAMASNSAEGLHGEYGLDILSNPGYGYTHATKTFTDPTGGGWDTITFNGALTPVSYPSDTRFTIFVNSVCVFDGWASDTPPGNDGQPFSVTATFAQSPIVEVEIYLDADYNPIERVALHYDSLSLSRQQEGQNPAGWNWAQSGWGNWDTMVWGSSTSYGPVMASNPVEGLHGEFGLDILAAPGYGGYGNADITKTFTDPTGVGWNTITFNGAMTPVSDPWETALGIRVNDKWIFETWPCDTPPGNNGQPFSVTAHFPQAATVAVRIYYYNDYEPIFSRVAVHYDSLSLSNQPGLMVTAGNSSFTITDGKGTTRSGFVTTGKDGSITVTDSNVSLPLSRQQGLMMTAGNSSFTITDGKGTTRSGFVTTGKDGTVTITDSTGWARNATFGSRNRSMAGAVRPSET